MQMIFAVFFLCSVCLSGGVVHQSLSFECQMGLEPSAGYYSLSVQFHNYSLPKATDCSAYCLTSDLCHAYYVFANPSTTPAFTSSYTYNCWIIPSNNYLQQVRGNLLQVSKPTSGSICTKHTSSPTTNSVSSTLSTATQQLTDSNFPSEPEIWTESISAENDLASETTTNIPAATATFIPTNSPSFTNSTSSTAREPTLTTSAKSTQISSSSPASTTSSTGTSTLTTTRSRNPSTTSTTKTTSETTTITTTSINTAPETTKTTTKTTPSSTATETTKTTTKTTPSSTATETTKTTTNTTPSSTATETTKTTTKTTPSSTTTKTTKFSAATTPRTLPSLGTQSDFTSNNINSLSPNSNLINSTSNTNNVLLPSSTSTAPIKPSTATATTTTPRTDFDVDDFKKMENETTWDDAFIQCSGQNLELVVVDTVEKMNFIANQVTTLYDTNCYWIDAQLLDDDGVWKTRDGISLNSSLIHAYLGSDPDNHPAVLCTEVVNTLNSPSTINWPAKSQTDRNGYICEKE